MHVLKAFPSLGLFKIIFLLLPGNISTLVTNFRDYRKAFSTLSQHPSDPCVTLASWRSCWRWLLVQQCCFQPLDYIKLKSKLTHVPLRSRQSQAFTWNAEHASLSCADAPRVVINKGIVQNTRSLRKIFINANNVYVWNSHGKVHSVVVFILRNDNQCRCV